MKRRAWKIIVLMATSILSMCNNAGLEDAQERLSKGEEDEIQMNLEYSREVLEGALVFGVSFIKF